MILRTTREKVGHRQTNYKKAPAGDACGGFCFVPW
jgi:hypothetical protein